MPQRFLDIFAYSKIILIQVTTEILFERFATTPINFAYAMSKGIYKNVIISGKIEIHVHV